MPKKWFKRSANGLFYRPATWHGWLILAIYLVLLAKNTLLALRSFTSWLEIILHIILSFVVLTLVLLAVCYAASEKNSAPQEKK